MAVEKKSKKVAGLPAPKPLMPATKRAAPPQREWQGLTGFEIDKLYGEAQAAYSLDKNPTYEEALVRAVEALLRSKNT